MTRNLLLILLLAPWVLRAQEASLKVGVAATDITPETPIWLSGYAVRQEPSAGVIQPLHAKALAINDGRTGTVVIVTVEVLGLSKEIVDEVRASAGKGKLSDPSSILFNSSHTHTGPVIWPCLDVVYELAPDAQRQIAAYRRKLTEALVGIIDKWAPRKGRSLGLAACCTNYCLGRPRRSCLHFRGLVLGACADIRDRISYFEEVVA